MADGHGHEVVDTVRSEPGEHPRQRRAPVVADDVRPLDAQLVEHTEHVAGDERQGVRLDLGRAIGVAEPAQVGHDAPIAGGGERGDLMSPQPVRVRPAVQQQHRRTAAFVLHLQSDPTHLVAHHATFLSRSTISTSSALLGPGNGGTAPMRMMASMMPG